MARVKIRRNVNSRIRFEYDAGGQGYFRIRKENLQIQIYPDTSEGRAS